jgi:hypothetical protein
MLKIPIEHLRLLYAQVYIDQTTNSSVDWLSNFPNGLLLIVSLCPSELDLTINTLYASILDIRALKVIGHKLIGTDVHKVEIPYRFCTTTYITTYDNTGEATTNYSIWGLLNHSILSVVYLKWVNGFFERLRCWSASLPTDDFWDEMESIMNKYMETYPYGWEEEESKNGIYI